jgi:hypothetical protein
MISSRLLTCSAFAQALLFGANCDCTHFPYKPESCEKTCSTALLQYASVMDLTNKIGLDATTANAIVSFRKLRAIDSISDLPLNEREKDAVERKLKAISSATGRELAKTYGPSNENKQQVNDAQFVQQIRARVIKDKSLSAYAHNVKIIVSQGKVTLRGPVHSEDEKQSIENAAREIAGEANVVSELSVEPK